MIHLGDITKIDGHKVPLVDVVTGGSPCQDLSVAGKRAGLKHSEKGDDETTRSGLFMEQIRLIKEMRDESTRQLQLRGADVDIRSIRPRYMVWENVPGAFSSNKGEDFRCVLEEVCRVADKTANVPMPEKGKWSTSGVIIGDDWSVAWRVHDAQFWGVPQRRKRIALVADFGGQTAPQILFECKSMSGDSEQSGKKRESSSTITERNTNETSERCGKCDRGISKGSDDCGERNTETLTFQERAGCDGGVKESLSNENEQEPYQPSTTNPSCLNPWDVQSKHIQPENGKAEALYSGECRGGGGESYVMQNTVYCLQGNGIDRAETAGCNGKGWKEDESYTLNTVDRHAICIGGQVNDAISPSEEVSKTLNCMDDPMKVMTFSDIHNALNARDGRSGVHSQMLNEPENNFVVCIGNGQTAQLKESDKVGTLNCMHEQQAIIVPKEPILLESNQDHATVQEDGVSTTLPASMGMGGGYVPMVTYSVDQGGGKSACKVDEEKSPTLTTTHDGAPAVCYGVDCYNQTQSQEVSKALNAAATDSDHIPCVYGIDRASFNQGKNALYDFSVEEEKAQTLVARGPGGGTSETVGALCARDYKGVGNQYVDEGKCIIHRI